MKFRIIKSAGLITAAGLGIALMGGCASQGGSSVAGSGHGSDQVCTYSGSSMGSHIGSRNCMSRSKYTAKQKAEHAQAQKNADAAGDAGGGRF